MGMAKPIFKILYLLQKLIIYTKLIWVKLPIIENNHLFLPSEIMANAPFKPLMIYKIRKHGKNSYC
jgi:hypothetical protein